MTEICVDLTEVDTEIRCVGPGDLIELPPKQREAVHDSILWLAGLQEQESEPTKPMIEETLEVLRGMLKEAEGE